MVVGDQDSHTAESLVEPSAAAIPRLRDAPARVLVVAAHPGTRAGIRALLERGGFAVCGEAANAERAAATALRERPELTIVHGALPGGGIPAIGLIKTRVPATAAVLLAQRADAEELVDALRAGASGYVLETVGPAGIARALQAVRRGESAIPRELLGALADEFRARGLRRRVNVPGRPAAELTRRQSEVLELLRRGLSTAEIAERLFISPVTVRRHVSLAVGKLSAQDRAAALRVLDESER
jgi:DNA-binding NarL/FixJ family response regulator